MNDLSLDKKEKPVASEPINFGFIPDEIKPEDHQFGSASADYASKEVLNDTGDWFSWLPVEEHQAFTTETQGCVSFGTLNIIEILLRKQYGEQINFSDRFLAKVSGTTKNGNAPGKVGEYLRKLGAPLQSKWDYTQDINTWEKFYEDIPAKVYEEARKDFLDKYEFKHYIVPPTKEAIKDALRFSPVGLSVAAWAKNSEGVYYQFGNDNHWTLCFNERQVYDIFDSYDDYTKEYSLDATPAIAKGYYIKKKESVGRKWTLFDKLLWYWK